MTENHRAALSAADRVLVERFLRYVSFPTTSSRENQTAPSTPGQLVLAEALCKELQALGAKKARVGKGGVVYAELPATPGAEDKPAVWFVAHMDTSPDAPGGNIRPQILRFEGENAIDLVVFEDGTKEHYDGVFIACGSAGAFELSKKLGLETKNNKIVTDETRATNVSGIFAAGDCIAGLQQVAKAVCDGMIAGTQALKFLKANS